MPALLGVSANAVHGRLTDRAPLVSSGLVAIDSDGDVSAVDRLRRLATVPGSACRFRREVACCWTPAPASELEWSDFDHIAEGRNHIERLIQGALRELGTPGVNVLLYGPPGTGKTEFCKVLAERLGVTLYSVGEADDDGDEPSRGERLQELRLAQRLLSREPRGRSSSSTRWRTCFPRVRLKRSCLYSGSRFSSAAPGMEAPRCSCTASWSGRRRQRYGP